MAQRLGLIHNDIFASTFTNEKVQVYLSTEKISTLFCLNKIILFVWTKLIK